LIAAVHRAKKDPFKPFSLRELLQDMPPDEEKVAIQSHKCYFAESPAWDYLLKRGMVHDPRCQWATILALYK
jgi:hypothetical protein